MNDPKREIIEIIIAHKIEIYYYYYYTKLS